MDDELPRIVNKKELRLLVPYSPQHILRLEKDNEFPKRIQIGKRRVGWSLKEIKDWIAKRVALGNLSRRGATCLVAPRSNARCRRSARVFGQTNLHIQLATII